MNRLEAIYQLEKYQPYNEQETLDKQVILDFMNEYEDIFYRTNLKAHISASAWVVNKDRTKVLMCYHNIYNSWSWLGGHNDGECDSLKVAVKEVCEEANIQNVKPVSTDIFSVEILSVDGHIKRGKYVNTHLHLNLSFLLEADENETLHLKEDENSGVAWFELDEALEKCSEPWMVERVYSKLNSKLKESLNK